MGKKRITNEFKKQLTSRRNFGINNNTISDNFQDLDLKFDMRAIAIALAINMGQIEISMLIRMTSAGADGDPLTPTGSSDGTLDVSGAVTDNVCAIAGDISDKEIACDFPF